MGLFSKKPNTGQQPSAPRPTTDWSNLDNIRREWPQAGLDRVADRNAWGEGLQIYNNDDYMSMMRCVQRLSPALAHSLYDTPLLVGDELPETLHHALYAAVSTPPDGRTFADHAQKSARLILTLIRENGWQPASLGGSGQTHYFDTFLLDPGTRLLLQLPISPSGLPWEGDLAQFFAVPPRPVTKAIPDAPTNEVIVSQLQDTLALASEGDPAGVGWTEGMKAWGAGDLEGALAHFGDAARHGSLQAMHSAGEVAMELGRADTARFWYETGAETGNPASMFDYAVYLADHGDRPAAAGWFQRAAEGGVADGFAALTQLAADRDDEQAEAYWASRGAEVGQTFCLSRHGMLLLRSADQRDTPTVRRARDVLEAAAERGDHDAMLQAAGANGMLGDEARAERYFQMARATGDPRLLEILDKYGH